MTGFTTDLDGARTILLEEPPMGQGRDACTALLTDGLTAPNVLFITYTRQPSACVEQISEEEVDRIGVIMVGDASGGVGRSDVRTESVSTPSDLTGLGIEIGQFLSEWDAPVLVCFDSLTSMLQYVEFDTAYEFLHAITGQVHAAGSRAHFHIDPRAHDQTTVDGIASLFDARVSVGETTTVRTRDIIQ